MPEIPMNISTPLSRYQVTFSMTAAVLQDSHEWLTALEPGTVVVLMYGVIDAGMIEAACDGHRVRVFRRDLLERSQRIEVDTAA